MTAKQTAAKLVHVGGRGTHWQGHISIGDPKKELITFQVSSEQMARLQAAHLRRHIANAITEAVDERDAELIPLLPDPSELSGWDDPGVDPDIAEGLARLAHLKGVKLSPEVHAAIRARGEK